jgi:hypothetical protein
MNLRELKESIAQIGNGHSEKPVAIIIDGKVYYTEATIAIQGDRILIDAGKAKR